MIPRPYRQKPAPEKSCEACGRPLERKRYPSGVLESMLHFGRRKFCNQRCMSRSFRGRWKEGVIPAEGRYRARTLVGKEACERCGGVRSLDVHHRDQDPLNNDPANLEVLCRSCHVKAHRPKPTCSLPGCDSPHKGHGYCEKHYQRWKKWGTPLGFKRNQHTPFREDEG